MRLYEITPYSHKQHYAIKKSTEHNFTQAGSGWADALGKIAATAGKIASNPAVQNLGKAGLEIGTTVAGHMIANKLVNDGYNNAAQVVQTVANDPRGTLETLNRQREEVKDRYKNGALSKAEAIELLKKIDAMKQSGGVMALKKQAIKRYKGGMIQPAPVRPVYRPAVMPANRYSLGHINPVTVNQSGGIAPAVLLGLSTALPLLASLVSPVIEKVSSKFMVPNIPGLG